MNTVKIRDFEIGAGNPLALFAGPCVLEGLERSLYIGREIKAIANRLGIPYVFKASFDKANRSSFNSFRGPGLEKGLAMLAQIKKELDVPVITDIHTEAQAKPAAEVVDILQIPAFLCRQTDLVYQAALTGKPVNVKKGQFLSPKDMRNVVDKILEGGNSNILLTERGASFGYPVVFDATHSVQIPGGLGTASSGNREYVEYLTRAAVGAGVDALFMEVHDNPEEALSDGPNMVYLDKLEDLLKDALSIHDIVRKHLR